MKNKKIKLTKREKELAGKFLVETTRIELDCGLQVSEIKEKMYWWRAIAIIVIFNWLVALYVVATR